MDFLKAQFTKIPRITPTNLSYKTVLITGANSGLGLEAARDLLHSKPERMILAVRNIERGEAAAKELNQTKAPTTTIDVLKLDQESLESVHNFADNLKGKPIDIAVLNAGTWNTTYTSTPDGYEGNLQVNALAPALLSLLLLPNLRAASARRNPSESLSTSRMVFVTSGLHEMAKFPESTALRGGILSRLNDPDQYIADDRYAVTKSIEMLWMKELARRVPSSEVIINGPNPGFSKTGIMSQTKGVAGCAIKAAVAAVARDPAAGARCIVDAAIVKGPESHGKYLSEVNVKEEAKLVRDGRKTGLQGKLWEEITELLRQKVKGPLEVPTASEA